MRRLLATLLASTAVSAAAQHAPAHHPPAHPAPAAHGPAAHGPAHAPPTGLSASEMHGLRTGAGMGLARPAELHRFPGPLHVLELADTLGLDAAQRTEAEALRARVLAEATTLGRQAVDAEHRLDALFAAGAPTPEAVQALTTEIGLLRARIRYVHLRAHLDMRAALTDAQAALYHAIRHP